MKTIWYMGVKSRLIPGFIDEALEGAASSGSTLLDMFSGSAAVSASAAARHRVLANDVQAYASTIARSYLLHSEERKAAFLSSLDAERDLGAAFRANYDALASSLEPALAVEDAFLDAHGFEPAALDAGVGSLPEPATAGRARSRAREPLAGLSPTALASAYRSFALAGTPRFEEGARVALSDVFARAARLFSSASIDERRRDPSRAPYLLATAYYPNVYLGIRQAIATDSLRCAIDRIDARDPFAREKRDHYLSALLHALSVTTSATSHFCQPRGLASDGEIKAVLARRSPSIASRALAFSREIAALVEATPYRPGNGVTNGDWRSLDLEALAPDVVYLDPPYTADNYSRFYHVLEVVTRYDYPPLDVRRGRVTKGRYPAADRRHQSAFCRRATVERELHELFQACARAGSSVVLSYSKESGLALRRWREDEGLDDARALERFCDLARASYAKVELREKKLRHSGQGDSNPVVTELLLTATKPRPARAAVPRTTRRARTARGTA